jgi:hypothetical protein
MKRVEWVAEIGLIAATAAAILLAASHEARASRERPVRLVPAPRPEAGPVPRRRCVRLGWKAPYGYAGE